MNTDWQQFLQSRGAVFEHGRVVHFGDAAEELRRSAQQPILADLSHYALIRLAGDDAQTFLQGQVSNDVRWLNGENSQWAAYCTPKGRMLASFLLWRDAQGFLMQLPASLKEPIRKRLSMFVLRSKVTLSDESANWVCLGLAGPGAGQTLGETLGVTPPAPHGVLSLAEGTLLSLPGGCFEILTPPAGAPALWDRLAQRFLPVGSDRWDWHLLRAGIPVILPATQEEFVPQMVNFELVGGVSFKKGCYPGQEIVARTQYLGKPKRRMYLAHLTSATPPQPGDALFSADMGDQASGVIVNAAAAPEGGYDVLAVIHTASAAAGSLHWKRPDGPVLQLGELPYAVPL